MPRNSSGAYSLPSGTLVSSGETVLVSQHNPAMVDIAAALTGSLDRGGTGGMTAPLNMNGFPVKNVAPGTDATDVATVSQVNSAPIGAVLDFAGAEPPPPGWLLCGGQSLSRTTYSALFAVIGTTYGSVDSTSFNLPDCRGRVSAGRDFTVAGMANRLTDATMTPSGGDLGATGGTETHTLTDDEMPSHTHAISGSTNSAGSHQHTIGLGNVVLSGLGGGRAVVASGTAHTSTNGAHSHTLTATAAASGGDEAHPNVQPTILFNKIIYAGTA